MTARKGRPPTPLADIAQRRIEEYMGKILGLLADLGQLTEEEKVLLDLSGTPARVAKMWVRETLSFPSMPVPHLTETEMAGDITCVGPIGFASTCAHHLMPFMGHAWIAYLADTKLLGLSKFTRVVRSHSKKFQLQEKLTRDILDYLVKLLEPRAMLVVMRASHGCVQCRGVEDATQQTVTSAAYLPGNDKVTNGRLTEELYRVMALTGGTSY